MLTSSSPLVFLFMSCFSSIFQSFKDHKPSFLRNTGNRRPANAADCFLNHLTCFYSLLRPSSSNLALSCGPVCQEPPQPAGLFVRSPSSPRLSERLCEDSAAGAFVHKLLLIRKRGPRQEVRRVLQPNAVVHTPARPRVYSTLSSGKAHAQNVKPHAGQPSLPPPPLLQPPPPPLSADSSPSLLLPLSLCVFTAHLSLSAFLFNLVLSPPQPTPPPPPLFLHQSKPVLPSKLKAYIPTLQKAAARALS